MTTSYPGAVDSFTNPTAATLMDAGGGLNHDEQHANINDAVEAIETELGTNPRGAFASVDQRITSAEGDVSSLITDVSTLLTNQDKLKYADLGITIDGGGSAITTGVKGYLHIPWDATVTGWTLLADQSGSIVVDVWKDTYANYPPTVADTIAGTEKPTLSSVIKNQDLSLSSWTTALTKGQILGFNVDSASTVTRVHLAIHCTRI